ncbi:MAG: aspartate-alanine antiporter, partial [Muribaculaceae bacterium]|nr:aspartate-alanine antiporter [Muribaculaceae bacterium]
MEILDWLVKTLRDNPAIAIFLTLGTGFWIGKLKYKTFSLGTVTSVLLVGVLVGQLDIPVPGPLKQVFFLLFLFAIGYSVGPQFFASLKGSGLKQVLFAVVMCLIVLGTTFGVAQLFHYNKGEAAGLFAGAQTISAVIGVADDTIQTLNASASDKTAWINIIPVAYAVTYIFGTIGSAWLLGTVGPMLLGGLKKVKQQTEDLERSMNQDTTSSDPALVNAWRPVVYRAYKATGNYFDTAHTVEEIEEYMQSQGRRLFIERIRSGSEVLTHPSPDATVKKGDDIVISGRREFVIEDESWLGNEISDASLLSFTIERIPVMVASKHTVGITVAYFRESKYTKGVVIDSIKRGGVEIPVTSSTRLQRGDILTISGSVGDVNAAASYIGYADKPTTASDMVFVGIGIAIGALIGAITIHLGGIPVSLSTSGGALIAGLVLGWLRSKHPTFGRIPDSAVWVFNNVGLNMFIAVVGISAGPTFISGLQQVGWQMLVAGILATGLPLIIGVLVAGKIFKFHPAIALGCVAGSRTTTAALGAIQDSLQSTIPAMGYTVTYAIGNTLLILCGLAM